MTRRGVTGEAWVGRVRPAVLAGATLILLAACSTTPPSAPTTQPATPVPREPAAPPATKPRPASTLAFAAIAQQARIVDAGRRLECVVYAREASGIDLRGDAAAWWDAAAGRYDRGSRPEPGAILVFRRTTKSVGHLAVITRVLGPRLVVASHANWLNGGRVHEGTPIEDVSAAGDWSSVRVWYTPGRVWGRTKYATYGFIYPRAPLVASAAGH
jgi:hypothetical protein